MQNEVNYLTTEDVARMREEDATLLILDVRTEPEWEAHHIPGALLIPMQTLLERLDELDRARKTVVVCEHGIRSENVAHYLAMKAGFSDVSTMSGGMAEWTGPREFGP